MRSDYAGNCKPVKPWKTKLFLKCRCAVYTIGMFSIYKTMETQYTNNQPGVKRVLAEEKCPAVLKR